MNKKLLFLFGILACWISGFLSPVNAQSVTINNVPPLTGGVANGGVSFNFTTSQNIVIDSLRSAFYTSAGDVTVWYNPNKINGTPTIDAANGWINLGTVTSLTGLSSIVSAPILQTIPLNLELQMNPQDTFGFYIDFAASGLVAKWYGAITTGSTDTTTFTDGVVTIIADASSSYGGSINRLSSPRQLNGGVVYHLDVIGDCPPFADFQLDSILDTGFKVDWTPGDSSSSFYFEYGLAGFTPGTTAGTMISGTYPGTGGPPLYITGLTADTEYDYYFGEICNSGMDSVYFPDARTVKTTVPCPAISGPVNFVYRDGDSVAFEFQSYGTDFDFEYDTTGFTPGTGITGSGGNLHGFAGLDPLTTYDIYIRNNCSSAGKGTSTWYGPVTVITRCEVSMSGTYTVDPALPASATNFQSLTAMADEMNTCGLAGPVTVNIAQGAYNEQVYLGNIEGSSPVNTILIQASPSNTTPVEVNYSAVTSLDNYIFKFDSTSYISVKGLTLTAGGTGYARVLDFTGRSTHITIEDNILNGLLTASSTSQDLIVVMNNTGADNHLDYLTLKNNEIHGGSYAMYMYGPTSSDREKGMVIENNTADNFLYAGLWMYFQDSVHVQGNSFQYRNASYSSSYGASFYYVDNLQCLDNIFVARATSTTYGLRLYYINTDTSDYSLVANNMISALDNTTTSYGMYIYNCVSTDVVHNSVNVNGGNVANGHGVYINTTISSGNGSGSIGGIGSVDIGGGTGQQTGPAIRFMNNIIAYTGDGVALEVANKDAVRRLDYNNYYFTGENLGNWEGTLQKSLPFWRFLSIGDTNSLSIDPLYASEDSLYASATPLNNRAYPFSNVITDIDGRLRSAIPDIGANEIPYIIGDCNPFTNWATDSIKESGLKVNWTPGSGNTGFHLEYGPVGFTRGGPDGTVVSGTYPGSQPPVYVNGLTQDSQYDFYFSEFCNSGADSSYLRDVWTIKTPLSCPPVTGPVVVEYASSDSVAFSFQSTADSNAYFEYEYGPVGYTQGTGTQGVFTNPGGFSGLSPLTYYDLYIRSNCSPSGGTVSSWFGPYTFLTTCVYPLSGNYTIDHTRSTDGVNFQSFEDLVFRLRVCGISGPVTVNVAQGTYVEQIYMDKIAGASETNTIVFQADPTNTAPVEIEYEATSADDNYIWKFDSTSYVTVRGLTLTAKGSTYGRVIDFYGNSKHIVIEDNVLNGVLNPTTTSTNITVITCNSGVNNPLNYTTIKNNEINGGGYGIYMYGVNTTIYEVGNIIDSNQIEGFYYTGIMAYYQDSLSLQGNTIISLGSYSTVYGVNISSLSNLRAIGNTIAISGTTNLYGLNLNTVVTDTSTHSPSIVANNMISSFDNINISYGIYSSNCDYMEIAHNSINIEGGSPINGRGIYINASGRVIIRKAGVVASSSNVFTGVEILNNNVVNTGGGVAIEVTEAAVTGNAVQRMDYNNYYVTGMNIGSWNAVNASDLTSWKAITTKDIHSVSGKPLYTGDIDLHVASPMLKGAGTAFPSVTHDYDGETRSLTTPDIGADEFTLDDCWPSFNVDAITIYTDSMLLNWFPGAGNSYNLEYGPEGYTQGSGTKVTGISDSTHMLTGLSTQVTYDIYVSDYCGAADTSIWFGPISIRTKCVSKLSGNYTIDNSLPSNGTNYASFAEAALDLNDCGISGPVTFTVAGGNYTGRFQLNAIEGADDANRVTFQSDPADTQAVVLQDSALGLLENYVIKFNGTSYVTIKGITVQALGTQYARVIDFVGTSSHIVIEDNILIGASSVLTSQDIAVIMNNSTVLDRLDYTTIRNNTIRGGSYGIYWYGVGSTDPEIGNVIEDNIIEEYIYAGIWAYYQDSISINRNTAISAPFYSTVYGIRLYYGDNSEVQGNKVVASGGSTCYGLYLYYCSGKDGDPVIVANNMVSTLNNSGTTYGMYIGYSDYIDVVFNSVLVNAGSLTAGHAFYIAGNTTTTNMSVRNNNIVNTGGGLAVEVTSLATGAISSMDYNNLYVTGSEFANWGGTSITDFAMWKTVSTHDTNSVSGDPLYIAVDDLHFAGILLDDAGVPYPGVTTDIDGETRSATTPDIGADEYTPLDDDVAVTDIIGPFNNSCGDASAEVSVIVKNFGITPASGFTIDANVNGANASYNYSNTLAPATTDTVQISPFNTISGGTLNIEVYSTFTDDMNNENDTLRSSVDILNASPLAPSSAIGAFCTTGEYDTLYSGELSGNYYWFTTDGDTLGNAESLTVGPLGSSDTTFLLSQVMENHRVGPDSNNFSNGGNYSTYTAGLLFEVESVINLDSVYVYPNDGGDVVVNISSGGMPIASVTHTVPSSAAGKKTAIPVGVILAPGSYQMDAVGTTTGGMYRNEPGAAFPYVVTDVVKITNATGNNNYYYFFYDWHVREGSCPRVGGDVTITIDGGNVSGAFTATPGNPTTTSLTVDFDASASIGASQYDWDFGDGNTGTGMMTTHTYTANGSYTVTLTITNDCGAGSSDTETETVTISGIGMEESILDRSLEIYPNPTSGRVQLYFETAGSEDVRISLSDLSGKVVHTESLSDMNGVFNRELNLENLAKGTYLLRVESGNTETIRKLIKQ